MFSNRIPPIISGWLPSAPKPGSSSSSASGTSTPASTSTGSAPNQGAVPAYYHVGHAYLRTPPIEPFAIPSPLYIEPKPKPRASASSSSPSTPVDVSTNQSRSNSPSASAGIEAERRPALEIRELGYGVFYPISKSAKSLVSKHPSRNSVNWVPEPEGGIVDGYEKFLGPRGMKWLIAALRLVVGRMKMPVTPYAPLAPPPSTTPHPLVIFSHGLAGTRNTYSQYCSNLASRGYVVLAIEHRDGSGPAVLMPDHTEDAALSNEKDEREGGVGKLRTRLYTKLDDLEWIDGRHHTLEDFRTLQLDMRVREVYEVFHSFRRLVDTESTQKEVPRIVFEGLDDSGKAVWVESFAGKVDCRGVDLTGHSFGGGTVMHLLQTSPPKGTSSLLPIPARRCIALDPWLEPLPVPAPTPAEGSQPDVPLLVINSPGFTVWGDHFRRLSKVVQAARGSLFTLMGSNHQSFSDFPLLAPGSPAFASSLLTTVHDLSIAFLNGSLASAEAIKGKVTDDGKFTRGEDGKGMAGKKGEVVVHFMGIE